MPQPQPARLLVVDDNPDNREVLGRRLQRLGHRDITYAADGLEAHALLQGGRFDAMLLDVMMPRMSGVELLALLRDERRLEDTPVIMISADTEIETVVRCIELGAEDYLSKPFNPVLLRARLAAVLEKRALRAQVRAQLAALEADLAQARIQQLSMVPSEFPATVAERGIAVHAAMHPAREVGGDVYDCFEVAPHMLCVTVGDVSGKGMPAALFMARARSLLRAMTLHAVELTGTVPGPAEIAALVNRELCLNNPTRMFITLFFGFLDVPAGKLAFVNAGHVRPYLLGSDGSASEVSCPADMPLGIVDVSRYRTHTLALGPGEGLAVLTDGLAEAIGPDGAFYTAPRVLADLIALGDAAPHVLIGEICARVLAFSDPAGLADDVTALALRLGP